jgi:hypothetical protein
LPGKNRLSIAAVVGGLFFPRSAELGVPLEDTVSPRVLAKMIYAGTSGASFQDASRALEELANLSISDERVRRACGQVGRDRIEEQTRLQEAFCRKSLPEQAFGKPADVEPPEIACVMADGGRLQLLDRAQHTPRGCSARKGEHWKESRIGLLARMSGQQHETDPQPTLPASLRYRALAEKLTEFGKTGRKCTAADSCAAEAEDSCASEATVKERLPDDTPTEEAPGLPRPKLEQRSVIASRQNWEEFGPLLESQAWYRGFAAAKHKVFVSDGSPTIEKLQQTHFSHYTSVLDLLHALSYSLAAARAVSSDEAAAEKQYNAWAAMIWEGRVAEVIAELISHEQRLGPPPPDARSDDPRELVRSARGYYENHASRMDYPYYRRQGYPLTSSLMESTVKQVSCRVKGSEKYWSSSGGEALLRLRGEYLSEDRPLPHYFAHRPHHTIGTRTPRRTNVNK